jgi:hypothetical protein
MRRLAEGRRRTDNRGRMSERAGVLLAASILALSACMGEADDEVRAPSTTTAVATLSRPLHFRAITEGRCPASRGRYVVTPLARGVALGSGLVRCSSTTQATCATAAPA